MTKRVLVYYDLMSSNYHSSQEFDGDRAESRKLQGRSDVQIKTNWDEALQPIHHLRNLADFKKAVRDLEDMYGYEHIPLIESDNPPIAEQVWMYIGLVMQLYSKYDEIIYHDVIFTHVNCNGIEITRKYPKTKDFLEELRSDNPDIPMLDDEIKSLKIFGVEFYVAEGTSVAWVANYLS